MYRPGWLCCSMDLEDLEDLEVFTFISYSCYLMALPFPDLACLWRRVSSVSGAS
jgi:hypothetical protein